MSSTAFKGMMAILVVALAVLGGLYVWRSNEEPEMQETRVETEETSTPQPKDRSRTEEAPETPTEEGTQAEETLPGPVPALDASDEYLRTEFTGKNGVVDRMLAADHLIRKASTAVELMSLSRNPGKQLHFLRPEGGFKIEKGEDGKTYLAADNYLRYDPMITALESLSSDTLAAYYQKLGPVFDEAYNELGNLDQARGEKFDHIYEQIVRVQVPEGPIELIGSGGIFIFADPNLEGLTPLEKAFIRMGPQNTRRVQAKLRDIKRELGAAH
ncbi:DUF3014 domain-containing protein [Sulfidibacter corallicola]|uniref:DUF3014 domain-containing protein n=1 Tax=Sulfidibacter corallicola TaxID=2818388 RepID=A0A8A4TUD0_SULCO|nr:DUF3014 domain-containing protein [Sulfidibacter corallicola]QTD53083.1 DUF3014 domain-containing protein [Sulfidibacter corallicola]